MDWEEYRKTIFKLETSECEKKQLNRGEWTDEKRALRANPKE